MHIEVSSFRSESDKPSHIPSGRPTDGELAEYAKPDINAVEGDTP